MRARSWTVHIGPFIVAAAVIPTLLGALAFAAPPAVGPAEGNGGGEPASPAAATALALPPKAENVPAVVPHLACTPLRGRRQPAPLPPVAVEGVLNSSGEQAGRRLTVHARRGTQVAVTLPADSFVGKASGDWLVYGEAGRQDSEVRAIDLETGCDTRLARVTGAARGALLSQDGAELYVHTVHSATRRDLGVTTVDLATGSSRAAMPAFRGGGAIGPVFATTLGWSLDGSTLAVQSCGADECHTRLLDVASGVIATFDEHHANLVGLTAAELIVFAEGHVRPAPLLAISRADGAVRVIAEEAYEAELVGTAGAPLLRYESVAGWQEVTP